MIPGTDRAAAALSSKCQGSLARIPEILTQEVNHLRATSTGLVVAGVGTVVSGLGAAKLKEKWGAGVLGFGLAHILLGLLDLARPSVRKS